MATGGSIESVSLNGRNFPAAADSDAQVFLGGYRNEKQSNGDGSTRTIKTRNPWMINDLNIQIDNDRGDLEFLQDLADSISDFPISATYADGNTYQGSGQITSDNMASTQSATMPISMSGPGKLTKQG